MRCAWLQSVAQWGVCWCVRMTPALHVPFVTICVGRFSVLTNLDVDIFLLLLTNTFSWHSMNLTAHRPLSFLRTSPGSRSGLLLTEPTPWFHWKHTGHVRSWAPALRDCYSGSQASGSSPVCRHNLLCHAVRMTEMPLGSVLVPGEWIQTAQSGVIRQNGSCQRGFEWGFNHVYFVIFQPRTTESTYIRLIFALFVQLCF